MLVTTFAVAFLLQSVALILDIRDGTIGEPAVVARVAQPARSTIGGVDIRKVTIVAIVVAVVALGAARAAARADDDRPADAGRRDRLPHRAAARRQSRPRDRRRRAALRRRSRRRSPVILTVQNPLVTPDFALKETIVVLVGVVVGGIDRLWTATLGGFAIGFATGVINGALPTDKTVYLPSVVFALVILVLLLRPAGLFARGQSALVERV